MNKTIILAHTSSYGLCAVLEQQQKDGVKTNCLHIMISLWNRKEICPDRKKALAVTWTSQRFKDYLIGLQYTLKTDHLSLVPLLSSKNLEGLPIRVQWFCLRLMQFDYTIVHIPGKSLCTADALSRSPIEMNSCSDSNLEQEVNAYVDSIINNLPETDTRLKKIQSQQNEDKVCQELKTYCEEEWSDKSTLKWPFKPYIAIASELCVANHLLLRGSRLVIPLNLEQTFLIRYTQGTKAKPPERYTSWTM